MKSRNFEDRATFQKVEPMETFSDVDCESCVFSLASLAAGDTGRFSSCHVEAECQVSIVVKQIFILIWVTNDPT